MSLFRRMSTQRLIGAIALVLVLVTGGVAVARSALSTGTPPPARPLDQAILDAASGSTPAGVTARISFTNTLIASGSLPTGASASPLLTGATGRVWIQGGGAFRLELQSDRGDTEIFGDGTRISVLDASTNTLYRLPAESGSSTSTSTSSHAPLSLAAIDKVLAELGVHVDIAGATPTTVAGQGAYETTLSPKHDGGLLGGLTVAFDAATGAPLRLAVTAAGSSTPVLELAVTDIGYGAVPASDVDVTPPSNVKVVDVAPENAPSAGGSSQPIIGLDAVRAAAGFTVTAPATLDGLSRKQVRLVDWNGTKVAVSMYGKGLGAIVVAELPASSKDPLGALDQLPSVSINGATGRELATALGTAITFPHGDVRTLVVGSVPTVAAEQAARELTS